VQQGALVVGLVRDWVPQGPFFADRLFERITTVRGSVEDGALLERTLAEYHIETVFHLAAQAIVGVAMAQPRGTFEANIMGTWNVLEAARKNPVTRRVVVASSDKAYGDNPNLPYDEGFPLRGRHPYDVSKSCADLISLSYHHSYGLPVTVTRCGNLYGPGDLNFNRIVPGTIRSALVGERPLIRSDGTPKRDYVFVKDAVSAYVTLAEQMDRPGIAGRAFNFGSGEPVSVLELTQMILRQAGRPDLEPKVLNEARGEIKDQYLNSELARKELGWTPGAPLSGRILESIAWYRSYIAAWAAPAAAL
jgi:CDP-glucose 4,6-dehydratase